MATIHDVAKLANVSAATVSRVINHTGYVKDETRLRVEQVITELGFHPSAMGQNLRRSRTHIVMLIVPEVTNPFVGAVVRSIEFAAREIGYSILLHEHLDNTMAADELERFVSTKQIDGMIFLSAEAKMHAFQRISDKCTTVLACEYVDQLNIPSVSIDNIAASLDVIRFLTGLGHTRILFINGSPQNISARDRLRGYRIGHEQAGIEMHAELILEAPPTPEGAYRAVQTAYDSGLSFTAVYCASDVLAIGAMRGIRDLQLRIPEDISVVGFDDSPFAQFLDPPLTSVYQPAAEIGRIAVNMWLRAYSGELVESPIQLPHALRIRASCAAPSRKP